MGNLGNIKTNIEVIILNLKVTYLPRKKLRISCQDLAISLVLFGLICSSTFIIYIGYSYNLAMSVTEASNCASGVFKFAPFMLFLNICIQNLCDISKYNFDDIVY